MPDLPQHPFHSVAQLVGQLLDTGLSDDDRHNLFALAGKDSQACDELTDLVALHAMLRKELGVYRPATLSETLFGDAPPKMSVKKPALSSNTDSRSRIVRLSSTRTLASWNATFNSTWFTTSIVAILFYCSFGLLALSLGWNMTNRRGSEPQQVANRESSATPDDRQEEKSVVVATLTAAQNGIWKTPAGSEPFKTGFQLYSHQWFELLSGTAEITFAKGAQVLLEAPIRFRVEGLNRATLTRGKLLARVPKQAVGFTIDTPVGSIVDLGTEFVVEVSHLNETRLAVIQGAVDMLPADATGAVGAQDDGLSGRHRFVAGQAVAISRSESGKAIAQPLQFDDEWVRQATQPIPIPTTKTSPETSSPYYHEIINNPTLVAYWKLDENGKRGAHDEIGQRSDRPMGRNPGVYYNFPRSAFSQVGALAGNSNTAVRFDGKSSYVDAGNHPSLNRDWEGITIAAWINPDHVASTDMALIAGQWTNVAREDRVALFSHGKKLVFAVADGITAEDGLVGDGNVPLEEHRYSFVVGTWEKATGNYRLYVNGKADTARGRQAGNRINPSSTIGFTIGAEISLGNRYFSGLIDEVALFNRALTSREVLDLFEAANSPNIKAEQGATTDGN